MSHSSAGTQTMSMTSSEVRNQGSGLLGVQRQPTGICAPPRAVSRRQGCLWTPRRVSDAGWAPLQAKLHLFRLLAGWPGAAAHGGRGLHAVQPRPDQPEVDVAWLSLGAIMGRLQAEGHHEPRHSVVRVDEETAYATAIRALGEVMSVYDNDKCYPIYGFGAKIPPSHSAHG